jgi:hypothetical protein
MGASYEISALSVKFLPSGGNGHLAGAEDGDEAPASETEERDAPFL